MKTNYSKISTIFILLIITATGCNFPLLTSPSGEVEIKNEEEITPTGMQLTAIPTNTISPTVEQPINIIDWSGVWILWIGDDVNKATFDLLQQDNKLTGSAVINNGNSIAFNGIIADNKRSVTGTLESTDGTSNAFTIYLLDALTQFHGNLDGKEPFCGARESSAKPTACFMNMAP